MYSWEYQLSELIVSFTKPQIKYNLIELTKTNVYLKVQFL